jgi:hypothetical protein
MLSVKSPAQGKSEGFWILDFGFWIASLTDLQISTDTHASTVNDCFYQVYFGDVKNDRLYS